MTPREIYALGYTDLVSVVPPGAKLSPNSKLKPDALGKVPGMRALGGLWHGYDWQKAGRATLRDVAQWQADGANVGMRAGSFPAIDIDCTDPALVAVIRMLAVTHLGAAPERQGRAPKTLRIYRSATPFGRMRLWIGGRKHLVEILGDGQQYVIAGIHPTTKQPYTWLAPLVEPAALAEIDRDRAETFLRAVAEAADMLGYATEREGTGGLSVEREAVNQADLSADLGQIAAAVAMIPNDNDHFAGRDDYLRMGYAIKAACGEAGLPVYEAWAAKWEGNANFEANDPDTVRDDWHRMKPPYEVGANFIFDTARDHGYNTAADEFEAIERPAGAKDEPERSGGAIQYSDAALADRFLKKHASTIRYCPTLGGWHVWNGARWARDDSRRVRHWVGAICKAASNEALAQIDEKGTAHKVATRVASNGVKNAVCDYAADHPAVSARAEQFDTAPMLLNTPAGVVDLTDGSMRPHSARLMMTKSTTVAPRAGRAPLWLAFLDEATAGDRDLQAYLQRLAGYALTGLTQEHALVFLYGRGGNGKGTFLNTLTAIWGDYAKTSPMSTFTASRLDAHPTAIADLAGARLVQSQETDDGRRWDEAKIKSLTGGDPVTARFMRQDFFTYQPQFKLLFAGNHRPTIASLDDAMRRRFHLVPFTVKPALADKTLVERLRVEHAEILHWAIEGALAWQRDGLRPPRAVVDATDEYFSQNDALGQWLAERTGPAEAKDFINTHALYEDWREWCGATGETPGSERKFVDRLEDKGYTRKKQGGTGLRGFLGLRLKYPAPEFQAAA
ncbi:phage/plasmid primase, P4 family [Paraburkholderia sp. RL18-103-BIB-C]|uniref:phage/plasmid primase, P4 family n=1 Tax=Paraburkholderia sp. RL18-103-BIB-C TaxID=3031637 RepID=UPI0038B81EDD